MEMKQLQYFVVSVDTGSISKAAEMLYTTQPHVSMTIGKMEKSLGVRLLRRSKKGVEMTVEGELVYEQARRILKDMQVIQQVQTSVKSEVFCLSSMPSNLLAGLFAEFYRRDLNLQARYLEGLLKTDLGNISCLMDSRLHRDSRIHRIELEDCRVKVCCGYIKRAGRELGGCSRRYIEYVKEGLE